VEKNFLSIRVRCETGVFGVDPATLEQVEDNGKLSAVITIYRDAVIRYNNVMAYTKLEYYLIARSSSRRIRCWIRSLKLFTDEHDSNARI
jgi:hypothetical protein